MQTLQCSHEVDASHEVAQMGGGWFAARSRNLPGDSLSFGRHVTMQQRHCHAVSGFEAHRGMHGAAAGHNSYLRYYRNAYYQKRLSGGVWRMVCVCGVWQCVENHHAA